MLESHAGPKFLVVTLVDAATQLVVRKLEGL